MDSLSFQQPSMPQVGLSVSMWFLSIIGVIIIRTELHPWLNVVMLSIVFPMYTWFMSRNNILGSISQSAMIATVIAAGLFMTLLLEARPKSSFSVKLKKDFKEYGRNAKSTAIASSFVAVSLLIGVGLSYTILKNNFIEG